MPVRVSPAGGTQTRRLALALAWLAMAGGVIAVAVHFWRWPATMPVLLAAGTPLLILSAAVAPLVFAVLRRWLPLAGAVVVLAAGVWTQGPLYLASGEPAPGPVVTVMQANVYYGKGDPVAITEQVRGSGIDVLAVEELTPAAVAALRSAGLESLLPYHHLQDREGAEGTGIWSKYPLRDARGFPDFNFQQLTATLTHPQAGPVQIYALHPVPPTPRAAIWHQEMGKLRNILAQRPPGPAIVAGDFNATHDHAGYRAMAVAGLSDTAEQAGSGPLLTWPTNRLVGPLIGIDHILVAQAHAEDVRTAKIPGTDHRAVIARLRIG